MPLALQSLRRAALPLGLLAVVAARPVAHRLTSPPSPLAGSWVLVAAERIGVDGSRRSDYGATPRGRLLVDAQGRYAVQIYSDERPRFASGNKARGTPEEYAATVIGMSAHYGTCQVDEAGGTLRFRIEQSAYRNWEGTEQVRQYVLRGDTLSYQVPASAAGDGSIAISVWRRLEAAEGEE